VKEVPSGGATDLREEPPVPAAPGPVPPVARPASAPPAPPGLPRTWLADRSAGRRPRRASVSERLGWGAILLLAAAGVLLLALVARARPSYDAMGWMVWGHQVLHWNLNTDGAPSWKPFAFIFTLPYALAGRPAQLWLWTLTAEAGGLISGVLAAHLAHRLTPPVPGREWARCVAAAIGGLGVLAMNGYLHLLLIANTDPLTVAVLLGAIEAHLSRRRWAAYVLLFLAGLDRPEAWALLALYSAWCWRAEPRMRILLAAGLLLTPVAWFVVPALTSHSWLTPTQLDMNLTSAIHGNKLAGVFDRLRSLVAWPAQIGVAVAFGFALVRRDLARLVLFAAAVLWYAIEVAFALHGFSAASRYLIEPAAVLIVLLGTGAGELLSLHAQRPAWRWRNAAASAGALVVLGLTLAIIPTARRTARVDRALISRERHDAVALDRLASAIAAGGGPAASRACGQPVSLMGYQSTLAWELGMNVGNVGFKPGRAIDSGKPIVFYKPHAYGWIVHADNEPPAVRARCARLDRGTAFG
jgi:hypothetical protein